MCIDIYPFEYTELEHTAHKRELTPEVGHYEGRYCARMIKPKRLNSANILCCYVMCTYVHTYYCLISQHQQ